jgi:hypothetical protein
MATGVICDYKTASVNKVRFGDFHDWRTQGLIYAWLLSRNKFPVTRCRFIALLKDHSKTEANRDSHYPQNPVFVYEFPVTQTELFTVGAFIRDKVSEYEQYAAADDNAIPACSAEERWEKATRFAVKKEGRQRAVRVFDTKEEAEQKLAELGKGHFIEEQVGESIRCEHYCLCREFCDFHNGNTAPVSSVQPPDLEQSSTPEKLAA